MLEDGYYEAEIRTAPTTGRSKQKKTPYLEIVWTLKEDETKTFRDTYYLTPSSLYRLQQTMLRIGFPAEVLGDDLELDPEEFVGKEGLLHIIVDTYEDKMKQEQQVNRVEEVMEPGALESMAENLASLDDPEIP